MPEGSAPGSWGALYRDHVAEWDRRVTDACGACGVDGVVVFSGAAKYRHRDDLEYPFFAEPYFKVWAPNAYPDSVLKIVPGETPVLVCLQHEDFWHMPSPEPSGFWAQYLEIRSVSKKGDLLKEMGAVPLSG